MIGRPWIKVETLLKGTEMRKILEFLTCPMSPEQEEGYALECAGHVLRYSGIALIIMMGIQIYNLFYVFLYTNGRLHTVASRVYFVLYLMLLAVSAVGLFLTHYLKKSLPEKAGLTMRLQLVYGFFVLGWGTCITIYDQRASDNVSVYLMVGVTTAAVIYFSIVQAMVIYAFFTVVLYCGIPIFRASSSDTYGVFFNITVMSIMSVFICGYRYISERRRYMDRQLMMEQNRQLNLLAERDSLTGLRNRRFLEKDIQDLYEQCRVEQKPVSMMMIDIDFFKKYNDNYGHQQGDECLRRTAWRLEQELGLEGEYLIRYGGEEFLYIGANQDKYAAQETGERFVECIRNLIIGPSERDSRRITVSIGIFTGLPGKDIQEEKEWMHYIEQADRALYMAKNAGRDRWIFLEEE